MLLAWLTLGSFQVKKKRSGEDIGGQHPGLIHSALRGKQGLQGALTHRDKAKELLYTSGRESKSPQETDT